METKLETPEDCSCGQAHNDVVGEGLSVMSNIAYIELENIALIEDILYY
jgi:hypothetical protein